MKYTQVRNPKWMNAEHTVIECEVNFDDYNEEFVPFGAVKEGDYPHTHEIFARCAAGEFGEIEEYIAPPEPTEKDILAQKAWEIRNERNTRLKVLDEVVMNPLRYASFTDEQKTELATYRQALLDVPQQEGFPIEVTWPDKPSFI